MHLELTHHQYADINNGMNKAQECRACGVEIGKDEKRSHIVEPHSKYSPFKRMLMIQYVCERCTDVLHKTFRVLRQARDMNEKGGGDVTKQKQGKVWGAGKQGKKVRSRRAG